MTQYCNNGSLVFSNLYYNNFCGCVLLITMNYVTGKNITSTQQYTQRFKTQGREVVNLLNKQGFIAVK